MLFPDRDLQTLLSALEDAAEYRTEHHDGWCGNCATEQEIKPGALCGDHGFDEAVASMYNGLHHRLQDGQGGDQPSFWAALWEFAAPTGWATQWYWPAGTHGKVWNLLHGQGWRIGESLAGRRQAKDVGR
jgi:hypothetical protein